MIDWWILSERTWSVLQIAAVVVVISLVMGFILKATLLMGVGLFGIPVLGVLLIVYIIASERA